jgi:hypothetical protein
MHMLKDAEENEDNLYGQEQRIAFMLEELDKPKLEEFLQKLEEFKKRVEIKKQRKNCLDVLEDIKEMIENQKEGTTEHKEKARKRRAKHNQYLKKDENSMLQSLEKSITLTGSAKDSTEMQTLNGKHVQLANPRHRKFLTHQALEVQAQQMREQQMTF